MSFYELFSPSPAKPSLQPLPKTPAKRFDGEWVLARVNGGLARKGYFPELEGRGQPTSEGSTSQITSATVTTTLHHLITLLSITLSKNHHILRLRS